MITTSKNIDGVQEITLIAPLKLGVVPCTGETLSYASRLRLLLGALFSQRKLGTESTRQEDGLLESLQILDFVRWALIDDDTKLMLGVSFDGPWEPYIRRIVDKAGPVLDAIFCHCADYAGSSCYDGYPKFSAWVRQHQIDIPFIHAANAELTVDDVRYLKTFESAYSRGDTSPFALASMPYLASPRPLARVYALFNLRPLFVGEGGTLNDQQYFDRVSYLILKPDFPALNLGLGAVAKANALSNGRLGLRDAATAAWLSELDAKGLARLPAPPMLNAVQDRQTVQGNILRSYAQTLGSAGATHGAFVLLGFKGKQEGAAFLKRISPLVSHEPASAGSEPKLNLALNLALTYQGLRTLGLTEQELELFPKEFQEGLEQRAGLLGDIGLNHPEQWSLPEANWPTLTAEGRKKTTEDPIRLSLVDAVLNLQTYSTTESHELLDELRQYLEAKVEGPELEILHVQPTRRYDDRGHAGAVDGVSQPVADGEPVAPYDQRDVVPVGELLLGYQNRAKEPSSVPEILQHNSTFIAIRNMSQDPAIYAELGQDQFARALGRTAEGENLVDRSKSNGFDYERPGSEQKCPFFAHVRRANPRTPTTPESGPSPRILRRGMSYGPPYKPGATDSAARGVMFTAIAASLADQYEVVQRWVNGGNSTGVFSGHPDLIAGTYPTDSGRQLRYRTANGVSTLAVPAKPAAVLRWGLYAFIPSLSALESLAQYPRPSYLPALTAPAAEPLPIENQFGAEPLSKEGDAAKARLEDIFRLPVIEQRLAELLKGKGIAREPGFGVIVGAPELVAEALTTPEKYSVRNYWARMRECDATLYLGMDRDPKALPGDKFEYAQEVTPGYDEESKVANKFILEIGFEAAFAAANAAAKDWFAEQDARYQGLLRLPDSLPPGEQAAVRAALEQPPVLDLVALAARVIRDVACQLYGLPKDLLSDDLDLDWPAAAAPDTAATTVRCPVDLTHVFAHVFPPRPSYAVSVAAKARGPVIKARIAAWYKVAKNNQELVADSPLLMRMRGAGSDEFVERTIIGLLSGFAVPTNGSLLSVLDRLVETDELWRLQRLLPIDPASDSGLLARMQPIADCVYDLMIKAPVPAMITRTAMIEDKTLKQGELVGLHLGAAAAQAKAGNPDAWKFLFGDLPQKLAGDKAATHPCPGQQMAFGVIIGTVYTLLDQKRLKKVPLDALTLSKYL